MKYSYIKYKRIKVKTELRFQKVLLITVGNGRDVALGIYFSIDVNNPNYVYFNVSEDSKEKTLKPLLEKLGEQKPNLIKEIIENE